MEKGDRVTLSQRGIDLGINSGIQLRFGTVEKNVKRSPGHRGLVYVIWDGTKKAQPIYHAYVEKAEIL
jgi:hypothetical protein